MNDDDNTPLDVINDNDNTPLDAMNHDDNTPLDAINDNDNTPMEKKKRGPKPKTPKSTPKVTRPKRDEEEKKGGLRAECPPYCKKASKCTLDHHHLLSAARKVFENSEAANNIFLEHCID